MTLKTSFLELLLFFIPYLFGLWGIISWRKKTADPDVFFFSMIWTLLSLVIYLGYYEWKEETFYLLFPLCSFLIFALSYRYNKTRVLNGFLFNLFLVVSGGYLLYNFYITKNAVALLLLGIIALVSIFLIVFGLISLVIFLYWNAIIVLRRESHSLANLLTLILAIVLTFVLLIDQFQVINLPDWLMSLFSILPLSLTYFAFIFLNFLTVSILYQFNHPRFNQDFIIVLGAGLIDGEKVSPLLAKRIDCALSFYKEQKKQHKAPKLIMSGGQGADEKVSEAIAMKRYAVSKNISEEDILVETNSTSTFENMKFSNEMIHARKEKANVIFSSNNYHIFRAGLLARKAGVHADGIGAKTALYYLPNAFLREFVAIIAMHKKRHFTVIAILTLLIVLRTVIYIFAQILS